MATTSMNRSGLKLTPGAMLRDPVTGEKWKVGSYRFETDTVDLVGGDDDMPVTRRDVPWSLWDRMELVR